VTGSLAYRKNEASIQAGDVPEKYRGSFRTSRRQRILEIGSAEGVLLALLLAKRGQASDRPRDERRAPRDALQLFGNWLARERNFTLQRSSMATSRNISTFSN
jgi:hypothetical protein